MRTQSYIVIFWLGDFQEIEVNADSHASAEARCKRDHPDADIICCFRSALRDHLTCTP